MNLKESATLLAKKQAHQNVNLKGQLQKTLLFVGSNCVGKTTLINRFLDRNEPAKKTLSLEYTFARKIGSHSLVKDVCHIWELGGGTLFTSVIENAASLTGNGPLGVVVMLDLSELDKLWVTLETLLNSIKKNIAPLREPRETSDHPDAAILEPFPVPLLIIGGKYDLFQEKEPERKKIVCRCLRYISHILCATLVFYSSKDAALAKRVKDALNHLGFGAPPMKTVCQDYNKPICIPSGSDLLESIEGVGATKASLDKVRHVFTTHFPQNENTLKTSAGDDPANDSSFREPLVDSLRRQKDQELERFCQEMERRENRKI
ncbi:cytoplasmic dynein 2 light intermediate chain 1 [Macrosteles quadrilineatus]|uniref:cytoplasmic dynein 2 light intermediate chain 1 n=1 Tax=Macrosteles quadrilineatus TaxID=74068 RepID=UPI0023E17C01|nr:cytoplasmic dynein 2 light intermediate chain 1 [Macrosteles quadrilineatus]